MARFIVQRDGGAMALEGFVDAAGRGHVLAREKQATGGVYQGFWDHGQKSGTGILDLSDDESYQGDFAGNMKEGYGVQHCADGAIYEGEFQANLRHGLGQESKPRSGLLQAVFREDYPVQGVLSYGEARQWLVTFKPGGRKEVPRARISG